MISATTPVGVPMFSDARDQRVPAEQEEHADDRRAPPLRAARPLAACAAAPPRTAPCPRTGTGSPAPTSGGIVSLTSAIAEVGRAPDEVEGAEHGPDFAVLGCRRGHRGRIRCASAARTSNGATGRTVPVG